MRHATAVATHRDAVVGDVDPLRIEEGAARAELRQHASPVRIAAVERALHELAAGDRLARRAGPRRPSGRRARRRGRASSHLRRRPPSAPPASRTPRSSASAKAWYAWPPGADRSDRCAAAPLASTSTVSLVLVHPSTTSALNVFVDRVAPARRGARPAAIAASVVTTASIVAIAGASIAAPFAIPPTRSTVPAATSASAYASLRTVSVVRIASAAAAPPAASARSCPASLGIPASIGAIGNGIPMSPVEQTSTSVGATPSPVAVELAHAAGVVAAPLPRRRVGVAGVEHDGGGEPVGADGRARTWTGRRRRQVRREHAGRAARHGGPRSRPSPGRDRPTASRRRRARPPRTRGRRSRSRHQPDRREPHRFGEAEDEVGGLDGLARRALDEVVDRARARGRCRCGRRSGRSRGTALEPSVALVAGGVSLTDDERLLGVVLAVRVEQRALVEAGGGGARVGRRRGSRGSWARGAA